MIARTAWKQNAFGIVL